MSLNIDQMFQLEEMATMTDKLDNIMLSTEEKQYLFRAQKIKYDKMVEYLEFYDNHQKKISEEDFLSFLEQNHEIDRVKILQRINEVRTMKMFRKEIYENLVDNFDVERMLEIESELKSNPLVMYTNSEDILYCSIAKKIPYDYFLPDYQYYMEHKKNVNRKKFMEYLKNKFSCDKKMIRFRLKIMEIIQKYQKEKSNVYKKIK